MVQAHVALKSRIATMFTPTKRKKHQQTALTEYILLHKQAWSLSVRHV